MQELQKMRNWRHRRLIISIELLLVAMRLSCEGFPVLTATYAAYLFRSPAWVFAGIVHMVSQLSFVLQCSLYLFPAICWAYGAGVVFSMFVSVVFWAAPLWFAYEYIANTIFVVAPVIIGKPGKELLERAGPQCAICWGSFSEEREQPGSPDKGTTATNGGAHSSAFSGSERAPSAATTGTAEDPLNTLDDGCAHSTRAHRPRWWQSHPNDRGSPSELCAQNPAKPNSETSARNVAALQRSQDVAGGTSHDCATNSACSKPVLDKPRFQGQDSSEAPTTSHAIAIDGESLSQDSESSQMPTNQEGGDDKDPQERDPEHESSDIWGGLAEPFSVGDCDSRTVVCTPCMHVFHFGCLSHWLHQCMVGMRPTVCPLCQRVLDVNVVVHPMMLFRKRMSPDVGHHDDASGDESEDDSAINGNDGNASFATVDFLDGLMPPASALHLVYHPAINPQPPPVPMVTRINHDVELLQSQPS